MALFIERQTGGVTWARQSLPDGRVINITLTPFGRRVAIAPWTDVKITRDEVIATPRLEVKEFIPPLEKKLETWLKPSVQFLTQAVMGLAATFDYAQNFSYPDDPNYPSKPLREKSSKIRFGPWWNQIVLPKIA